MKRINKDFVETVIIMIVVFVIGFLIGSAYENNKLIEAAELELVEPEDEDLLFWREGYLRRDSVINAISKHGHTTFEQRKILGDIY